MNTTRIPECWANDPNTRGVRIEHASEKSTLLPFDHFMFSDLESVDGGQRLSIVFVTHRVEVSGIHLERIETSLQRKDLSLLACIPARFEALVPADQPLVRGISVERSTETR